MPLLDQPKDLRTYYRDETVVSEYLDRRTTQPFNGFLHASQVRFLNRALRQRTPARILELAPGPARLTAELDVTVPIVALDTSAQMLAVARARLRARNRPVALLQGDAFRLPFADGRFDFVYTTKLIRHFQLDDRMRLYQEIRRVLGREGAFVMDAQSRAVSLPHRLEKGLESYRIYDVLYDVDELRSELEQAGFQVLDIEGIARHFTLQRRLNRLRRIGLSAAARLLIDVVERLPGGSPSTWMVLTQVRR
jgi:ubiquinone/menaquinone biosynthesis C-methylase UbiE